MNRRSFLKLAGGTGAGAAILSACRPQVQDFLIQSPLQMPEDMVTGIDNWYATRCAECGAGCGVVVRVVEGRAKKVEGNLDHPINAGKLCVRGHGSVQAVYHADRIRRPMVPEGERGSGRFKEITWDEADGLLKEGLLRARDSAKTTKLLLATNPLDGHLGLVASKFVGAFGGSVLAQYEPMDHAVEAAAVKKVFGTDEFPDFDIARAKRVLNFGADFLMGWLSQVRHSRGYGEFRQGDGRERGEMVHIGTRFSGTAANADEWLPVKPGTEGKVALAIAHVIVKEGKANAPAAAALFGTDPAAALAKYSPAEVAKEAAPQGMDAAKLAEKIEKVAKDFAGHQPGIALGGGAAGAQANGLFNLSAVYALNRLVDNVGKDGGVKLNPPSPFAADPLFRGVAAGKYAVTPFKEWQGLVANMAAGQVGALLLRNANIVHGMPAELNVEAALQNVEFIVSFSSFLDDATAHANLILPSHLPLEDWGDATPNPGPGHLAVSFQQPVVRPFHETRGFGDQLLAAAQDLGLEKDLPWQSYRDLLRESAQKLYQKEQAAKPAGAPSISFEAFWNEAIRKGGWWDAKAMGPAAAPAAALDLNDPGAGAAPPDTYALVPFEPVGVGDGRNAHLPWMQSAPDPVTTMTWITWVEMNSKEAAEKGWKEGDILRVEVSGQPMELPLYPVPGLPRGVLAVPVGEGHKRYGRYADKFGANVFHRLSAITEPATGALAWGGNRARVTAVGKRVPLPKLEGTVVPVDVGHNILIMKNDGGH